MIYLKVFKNYQKIIGLFGCILIVISCFLPFIHISLLNMDNKSKFIQGDGKLVLALVIVSSLLIIFNKFKTSIIPTITIIIVLIQNILTIYKDSKNLKALGTITYDIGFYMLITGIIICILFPFVFRKKNIS